MMRSATATSSSSTSARSSATHPTRSAPASSFARTAEAAAENPNENNHASSSCVVKVTSNGMSNTAGPPLSPSSGASASAAEDPSPSFGGGRPLTGQPWPSMFADLRVCLRVCFERNSVSLIMSMRKTKNWIFCWALSPWCPLRAAHAWRGGHHDIRAQAGVGFYRSRHQPRKQVRAPSIIHMCSSDVKCCRPNCCNRLRCFDEQTMHRPCSDVLCSGRSLVWNVCLPTSLVAPPLASMRVAFQHTHRQQLQRGSSVCDRCVT
jgi:hypothetical protein